ncbi:MAG: hypothetical protein MZU97_18185 [Bacillus subtilis]|nr:hypothetical protein [Bacillus subtilis]
MISVVLAIASVLAITVLAKIQTNRHSQSDGHPGQRRHRSSSCSKA